jgi:hypothetical protein
VREAERQAPRGRRGRFAAAFVVGSLAGLLATATIAEAVAGCVSTRGYRLVELRSLGGGDVAAENAFWAEHDSIWVGPAGSELGFLQIGEDVELRLEAENP